MLDDELQKHYTLKNRSFRQDRHLQFRLKNQGARDVILRKLIFSSRKYQSSKKPARARSPTPRPAPPLRPQRPKPDAHPKRPLRALAAAATSRRSLQLSRARSRTTRAAESFLSNQRRFKRRDCQSTSHVGLSATLLIFAYFLILP